MKEAMAAFDTVSGISGHPGILTKEELGLVLPENSAMWQRLAELGEGVVRKPEWLQMCSGIRREKGDKKGARYLRTLLHTLRVKHQEWSQGSQQAEKIPALELRLQGNQALQRHCEDHPDSVERIQEEIKQQTLLSPPEPPPHAPADPAGRLKPVLPQKYML